MTLYEKRLIAAMEETGELFLLAIKRAKKHGDTELASKLDARLSEHAVSIAEVTE